MKVLRIIAAIFIINLILEVTGGEQPFLIADIEENTIGTGTQDGAAL